MREWYERVLGDVKDLTRDLRDRTEEMERIKIREMETSSKLEGTRLDLLKAKSKLKTKESETGKIRPE